MTTHAGENAESLRPEDPAELGPYRLLGRLGRGGMGTVFLGQDAAGRRVAVKVINRELAGEAAFRERFQREVTAARQVRRFCTAPVIDAELEHDPLYVVTEYIEGPSLERAVAERGPLPGSDLEGIAVGMATALSAIHGAGIVHRDLKPANVLLSATGPRVIDFGIARALDAADGPTRTGQFVGTPNYLPPELLRGEPVSPASDVFAWGCVVAYAGTGGAPFAGNTVPEIFYRVAHEEPDLSRLDPALRDVVAAALDKDPRSRPTVQELLARLVGHAQPNPERIAETVQSSWHGLGPAGPRPSPAAPPVPPPHATYQQPAPTAMLGGDATRGDASRPGAPSPLADLPRKPLMIGAAAVAGVLVLGIGVWSLRGPDGPPDQSKLATVFSDTFANTGSGWNGGAFISGINGSGYSEGKYRFETDQYNTFRAYPAPKPGPDIPPRTLLTVNVVHSEGPDDATFGLYCHAHDDNKTLYSFVVRKDGKGAILGKAAKDRGTKNLATPAEVPGYKTKGTNKLQLACEDEDKGKKVRLRAWVNGEQAVDLTDTDQPLPTGWTGLQLASGGNTSIKAVAEFDDFDISKILD
ncbi:Serine/threonine-protein kinase PknD [Actinomadura sp. RB68]|uniref:Serine/threonine-protein kinase PknD n=2 Tax=Actinomadura macrotermitis TaxID=2585200 RepID=A0A7K0BZ05_9ACTN|nr:Serine/threonine-protein kinase PknD [Actinomadura macrotermitis]